MYTHILVPLDGSALAEQVLPHVQALSTNPAATRITIMRAVEPQYTAAIEAGMVYSPMSPEEEMERTVNETRTYLDSVAEKLRAMGFADVHLELPLEHPAEAIVDFVETKKVDLVVIATHGRSGVGRWMYGSVTQKVIHSCHVPLFVLRPTRLAAAT